MCNRLSHQRKEGVNVLFTAQAIEQIGNATACGKAEATNAAHN